MKNGANLRGQVVALLEELCTINECFPSLERVERHKAEIMEGAGFGLMFSDVILQAKKFLKCDWLRPVVFLPNLKYLHVKISVSMET